MTTIGSSSSSSSTAVKLLDSPDGACDLDVVVDEVLRLVGELFLLMRLLVGVVFGDWPVRCTSETQSMIPTSFLSITLRLWNKRVM